MVCKQFVADCIFQSQTTTTRNNIFRKGIEGVLRFPMQKEPAQCNDILVPRYEYGRFSASLGQKYSLQYQVGTEILKMWHFERIRKHLWLAIVFTRSTDVSVIGYNDQRMGAFESRTGLLIDACFQMLQCVSV